jgi:phage tail sheath protein FI
MAVYLAPGVYVEEVDLKPPSIEGVSLSTAGFVGATLRGPSTGRPVLVTSAPDFRRQFGGAFPVSSPAAAAGELPLAVDGFFANGGSVLYVVRVAPAGTTAAAITTQGGMVTRLVSTAPAAVGATTFRPTTLRGLRDGVDITFSMVNNGVTYTSAPVAIAVGGIDRALGTVTLAAPITMTPAGGPSSFLPALTTVTSNANGVAAGTGAITTGGRPASLTLNAASGGSWGNDLAVSVQTGSAAGSEYVALLAAAVDANQVQVKSTAGFYLLAWVEIDRGSGADRTYHQVRAINGPVLTLSGAVMTAAANLDPNPGTGKTMISTCEFSVAARYGTTVERFTGLTLENVPGRSVAQVLAGSGLIAVDAASLAAIAGTDPLHFPSGDDGLNLLVTTPGADAAPAATDIRGTDNGPGHRTGIQALLDIPSIGIIAAPGWGDQQVQQALIDQCELLRYRVALLDPELSGGVGPNIQTVIDQRKRFDTKYAALYYPRIVVATPDGNRPMGPSGHMAGLIARIDNLRGVFKTPANETRSRRC